MFPYRMWNVYRKALDVYKRQVEHCYDIESLLADEQVDIIYIATPHTYHYDYMMRALQHGKHVQMCIRDRLYSMDSSMC